MKNMEFSLPFVWKGVYEEVSLLGKGAFSSVFLVFHKKNKTRYALKITLLKNQLVEKTIKKEFQVGKYLHTKDDSFLDYYLCITENDKIYTLYEALPGAQDLKNLHVTEKEFENIMFQVLNQINNMHQLGIAHLDIKLANIISNKKQSTLIDFQTSCLAYLNAELTEEDCSQVNGGTWSYIPPEFDPTKEKEKNQITYFKRDIWSFGMCIIFYFYPELMGKIQPRNRQPFYDLVKQKQYLIENVRLKRMAYLSLSPYEKRFNAQEIINVLTPV